MNAELDQFIVRVVEDALLNERIVRLPNGFPTTDREADKFDAEAAKKDEHMRKMAAQMIKVRRLHFQVCRQLTFCWV